MSLDEKLIYAGELICNSSVLLSRERYDDGTPEKPDVIIDEVSADIEGSFGCGGINMDVVIYLTKSNDTEIWETYELYKIPFIEDLDILDRILIEAKEQSHVSWRDRYKPYDVIRDI